MKVTSNKRLGGISHERTMVLLWISTVALLSVYERKIDLRRIREMYENMRVNVKVDRDITLTFTRDLSYFIFTHVKITRHWKSTLIHTSPFFKRIQTSAFYALVDMALRKGHTFT